MTPDVLCEPDFLPQPDLLFEELRQSIPFDIGPGRCVIGCTQSLIAIELPKVTTSSSPDLKSEHEQNLLQRHPRFEGAVS